MFKILCYLDISKKQTKKIDSIFVLFGVCSVFLVSCWICLCPKN